MRIVALIVAYTAAAVCAWPFARWVDRGESRDHMADSEIDGGTRVSRDRPTYQVYASWPQRAWGPATPITDDEGLARRWAAALLKSARRCGFKVRRRRAQMYPDVIDRHRWVIVARHDRQWRESWAILEHEAPRVADARAMQAEHTRFDRRLAIADGRF